jgi:hypothetical protein
LLFPEPATPFTRPLHQREPNVLWLSSSTRPEAREARQIVNALYEDFPDPNGHLAARLKSATDEHHHSALDELLGFKGSSQHRLLPARSTVAGRGLRLGFSSRGSCAVGC